MSTVKLPQLQEHRAGILLQVRARAGARKSGIVGVHDGGLKVAVAAPPEKGKANAALVRTLADALGVNAAQITLISGAGSARKRFVIAGLTREELSARLRVLLDAAGAG